MKNASFMFDGVTYEVTTCVEARPAAKVKGIAFSFGLAILDNSGNRQVSLNSLYLQKNDRSPGGFRIGTIVNKWEHGSIGAIYFYANRSDPDQNSRYVSFLNVLMPALKSQMRIQQDSRKIDDDFYNTLPF